MGFGWRRSTGSTLKPFLFALAMGCRFDCTGKRAFGYSHQLRRLFSLQRGSQLQRHRPGRHCPDPLPPTCPQVQLLHELGGRRFLLFSADGKRQGDLSMSTGTTSQVSILLQDTRSSVQLISLRRCPLLDSWKALIISGYDSYSL